MPTEINYEPLLSNVIIKADPELDELNGFALPDFAVELSRTGRVVAVGPGHFTEDGVYHPNKDIKLGMHVTFIPWGGYEVKIDNEKYLMFQVDDLLCEIGDDVKVESVRRPRIPQGASHNGTGY